MKIADLKKSKFSNNPKIVSIFETNERFIANEWTSA